VPTVRALALGPAQVADHHEVAAPEGVQAILRAQCRCVVAPPGSKGVGLETILGLSEARIDALIQAGALG
jgi:hypothetical protein